MTWIRVHGRVQEVMLDKRVMPDFPKATCEARAGGTVHLKVTIARDGSIRDVKVVKGEARLSSAAQAATKKWRSRPTLLNGNPVEVKTDIYFRFLVPPPEGRQ